MAQTLADVTSAYLVNAQGRDDLEHASARSHERSVHDALTGCPTGSSCSSELSMPSSEVDARRRWWPYSSSTWTTSRRSMTRMATKWATSCLSP